MPAPRCSQCRGPFEGSGEYQAAWLYKGRLLCCWCAARSGLLGDNAPMRAKRRSKG